MRLNSPVSLAFVAGDLALHTGGVTGSIPVAPTTQVTEIIELTGHTGGVNCARRRRTAREHALSRRGKSVESVRRAFPAFQGER